MAVPRLANIGRAPAAAADNCMVCRVTDAVTAALEAYEFGEAGKLMYEFFWFDFADWYIEVAKSRLYSDNEESKHCTQSVLAYVLEASTRLWHPFIPYVTERLWKTIPHRGQALMSAAWPASNLPRSEEARSQFDILKQMVTAVRNARSEYNVEISKKVAAVLFVQDSDLRDLVTSELASICLLAKIDADDVSVAHQLSVCMHRSLSRQWKLTLRLSCDCRSWPLHQKPQLVREQLSWLCKRVLRSCCHSRACLTPARRSSDWKSSRRRPRKSCLGWRGACQTPNLSTTHPRKLCKKSERKRLNCEKRPT